METLVKRIEEGFDPNWIDEKDIATYVQAKKTRNTINSWVVEPFAAGAKAQEPGVLYSGDGLELELREVTRTNKLSAKEFVQSYENLLTMMLINNENDLPMTGVKRFDGVVAVDTQYLNNIVETWSDLPASTTTYRALFPKGEAKDKIARDSKGRLLYASNRDMDIDFSALRETDVALYLAGKETIASLEEKVIDVVEQYFKDKADWDALGTTYHNFPFGNMVVQVESVPQEVIDYNQVAQDIADDVREYADISFHEVDKEETFVNTRRNEPSVYVSIEALLDRVNIGKQQTELRVNQSVRVLYNPKKVIVLA